MKIISNFSDYYDAMQALGRDESVTFVRHDPHHLKFNQPFWPLDSLPSLLPSDPHEYNRLNIIREVQTGIQQKTPLFREFHYKLQHGFNSRHSNDAIPYRLEPVIAVVNGIPFCSWMLLENQADGTVRIVEKNIQPDGLYRFFKAHADQMIKADSWYFKDLKKHLKTQDDFLNHFEKSAQRFDASYKYNVHLEKKHDDELMALHQLLKTPVYYLFKDRALAHMPLSFFGLTNLLSSPQELYQEIASCLGNVILNRNEPPLAITDKDKITQHGFDLKQSFRHRTGG